MWACNPWTASWLGLVACRVGLLPWALGRVVQQSPGFRLDSAATLRAACWITLAPGACADRPVKGRTQLRAPARAGGATWTAVACLVTTQFTARGSYLSLTCAPARHATWPCSLLGSGTQQGYVVRQRLRGLAAAPRVVESGSLVATTMVSCCNAVVRCKLGIFQRYRCS